MAYDVDNIIIGASGGAYFGPVGTAGPTDVTTALNAAFNDAGALSEDGITFDPTVEFGEIRIWQSRFPAKRFETSRSFDISFTMMELKKENFLLAMGGGAIATATSIHTFTPEDEGTLDERAFVFEWTDGADTFRMHVPKGIVTDLATLETRRDEGIGLDVTVSVLASDGVASFTVLTDSDAWA